MGKRKALLPLSLVLSALNGLLALVPAVLVWFIVRTLINSGGTPEGTAVYQYAWWAFVAAVFSVLLYFVALMLSHLAAFRVECNLRTTAVNRLLHMPLGFSKTRRADEYAKSSTTMPGIRIPSWPIYCPIWRQASFRLCWYSCYFSYSIGEWAWRV